jgi:hypothetical protein
LDDGVVAGDAEAAKHLCQKLSLWPPKGGKAGAGRAGGSRLPPPVLLGRWPFSE